jgi:peptidoglycan/xylan/chitin deacetylase (PgdA/CDA1 family)
MEELRKSKEAIEFHLGKAVPWIAFPFGRYNDRVIEDSQACGYTAGFAFLSGGRGKNPFVFERKAVYLLEGEWNLRAKLEPAGLAAVERAKLRFINFCSRGTSLVKSPG